MGRYDGLGTIPTQNEIAAADAAVVAAACELCPDLIAVYRFGSSVNGPMRPGSDLDYAVLCGRPLESTPFLELVARLATAVRPDTDLVDLKRASTVLRMQVVGTGIVVRDLQPMKRILFDDFVFSAYARLNEERRGILERIARDGIVYGPS